MVYSIDDCGCIQRSFIVQGVFMGGKFTLLEGDRFQEPQNFRIDRQGSGDKSGHRQPCYLSFAILSLFFHREFV
jgi:hypothetical protein